MFDRNSWKTCAPGAFPVAQVRSQQKSWKLVHLPRTVLSAVPSSSSDSSKSRLLVIVPRNVPVWSLFLFLFGFLFALVFPSHLLVTLLPAHYLPFFPKLSIVLKCFRSIVRVQSTKRFLTFSGNCQRKWSQRVLSEQPLRLECAALDLTST